MTDVGPNRAGVTRPRVGSLWDPYRPDLRYRCPDCVTQNRPACLHMRPTVAQVMAGAYEAPRSKQYDP